MKTIMVWDNMGNDPIMFVVLDGDYRHLDRIYINADDDDEEKQEELNALLYDNDGNYRHKMLETFPTEEAIAGAVVIVAGFMP